MTDTKTIPDAEALVEKLEQKLDATMSAMFKSGAGLTGKNLVKAIMPIIRQHTEQAAKAKYRPSVAEVRAYRRKHDCGFREALDGIRAEKEQATKSACRIERDKDGYEVLITASLGPTDAEEKWMRYDIYEMAKAGKLEEQAAKVPVADQAGEEGKKQFRCRALAYGGPDIQDCNWPHCGCDPYANKVLESLMEGGYQLVDPTRMDDFLAEQGLKRESNEAAGVPVAEPLVDLVASVIWSRDYPKGGSVYKTYESTPFHDKEIYRREVRQLIDPLVRRSAEEKAAKASVRTLNTSSPSVQKSTEIERDKSAEAKTL